MRIEENIDLSTYTTMRAGGIARYFFSVETVEDIEKAVVFAEEKDLPVFILGGGSNVLVLGDLSGLVLKINLKGIKTDKEAETIFAGAGENWDDVVSLCIKERLYGLEALSGIPGSVGAVPVQNIGAYGVEAKDFIESVEVFDIKEKQKKILSNEECNFGYRQSIFKEKENHYIVTGITFKLSVDSSEIPQYKDVKTFFKKENKKNPTPKDIRKAIIEIRSNKLPDTKKIGTSGSFFKNPIVSKSDTLLLKKKYPDMPTYDYSENTQKLSAGWLIEHIAKYKGVREGNVGTYEKHALVIVNYGNKNGEEVFSFAEKIKKIIKEKTNVELEYEVVVV